MSRDFRRRLDRLERDRSDPDPDGPPPWFWDWVRGARPLPANMTPADRAWLEREVVPYLDRPHVDPLEAKIAEASKQTPRPPED
jgi:hypothetical protein